MQTLPVQIGDPSSSMQHFAHWPLIGVVARTVGLGKGSRFSSKFYLDINLRRARGIHQSITLASKLSDVLLWMLAACSKLFGVVPTWASSMLRCNQEFEAPTAHELASPYSSVVASTLARSSICAAIGAYSLQLV